MNSLQVNVDVEEEGDGMSDISSDGEDSDKDEVVNDKNHNSPLSPFHVLSEKNETYEYNRMNT